MNCSFDGIGQWAATFPRAGGSAGQAVSLNADGQVCAASDGGDFIGVVLSVGRDGQACSVALGGVVSVPCSGPRRPGDGLPLPLMERAASNLPAKAVRSGCWTAAMTSLPLFFKEVCL